MVYKLINSQFVYEIKNASTNEASEKFYLVVSTYNNFNKNLVLTQLLTIQQVSQYLIVCFVIILQDNIIKLYLCDVTQAYIQLTLNLNRDFFICPLLKLITIIEAPSKYILKLVKLLYNVPEFANHWFATYLNYLISSLTMSKSSYNFCLLHRYETLSIVGLQINGT